jgi:aminoglycoside phosphotransferase family enzyme
LIHVIALPERERTLPPMPFKYGHGMTKPRSAHSGQEIARTSTNAAQDNDEATARKVAFLSQPANYADAPPKVERIETHMSWVFLAGDHAYKLKKAVHYPFLDFSSAAARRRDCGEELRLNRRLAPGVYLGVVPLTRERNGRLVLDGPGEPVDWLVRMVRLPRSRMLDSAMADDTVEDEDLEAVARLLSGFYHCQPPEPVAAEVYRRTLEHDVRASRQVLLEPQYNVPSETVEPVIGVQLELLRAKPVLFDERVEAGRIVEGHGDLRPGHVFLGPPPQIIDCLEFNRELRIVDPLDELGYLAMECRVRGGDATGIRLLDHYRAISGDPSPSLLLAFYQSRRACLRARLCLRHITSSGAPAEAAWRERAQSYLQLARDYAAASG